MQRAAQTQRCLHCAVPAPVTMLPVGERPASIDLSLERHINAQSTHLEQDPAEPLDNGLLAPLATSSLPIRPIQVPCIDDFDQKLQALSPQIVASADGDEELLRLALVACSEHDQAGLLTFVEGVMKVKDFLGPKADRQEAAMKLMAGRDATEVIQASAF